MTPIGSLRTRDLTTTDDLDQVFDVRNRSFGPLDPTMRDWWNDVQQETLAERRAIGVFDGERLLAYGKCRSYEQSVRPRRVPPLGR